MKFIKFDEFPEFTKKNKIILILFVCFIVFLLTIGKAVENSSNKKELEKALYLMGEKIYMEVYYENIQDDIEQYTEKGIKLTLYDMFELTNIKIEDYFYNRKTHQVCDINNSHVIIYPKKPYKINDYDLTFKLACGY